MPIDAPESDGPLLAYLLFAALAGCGAIFMWIAGLADPGLVLAAQGAAAAALWLPGFARHDASLRILAMLAILILGPFGALGALCLVRSSRHTRAMLPDGAQAPLPDPPEADAAIIARALEEGRALPDRAAGLDSFLALLQDGDLADKQAMLGRLSQHYGPDYLPVLKRAMTSDDAPIRVSAAAVYAKLRETYRKPLAQLATAGGTGPEPRDSIGRALALAEAARSGFLSDDEAAMARAAALAMLKRMRPAPGVPDDTETLLCGILLDLGRHDDVEARLGRLAPELPAPLLQILRHARMHRPRLLEAAHRVPPAARIKTITGRANAHPRALLAAPVKGD